MSEDVRLRTSRRGELQIATVQGEVDLESARRLGAQLARAVSNDDAALVLDLTRVTYLDSAGVSMCYELLRRLRRSRQELVLIVPRDSVVHDVVELSGLGEAALVWPELGEALDDIESQGLPSSANPLDQPLS